MAVTHPDFPMIQRRLRRLDPAYYPASVAIDSEYGPAMAKGVDLALAALERARGLGPIEAPPAPPAPDAPPPRLGGIPPGMHSRFTFLYRTPIPPLMVRTALELFGTLERPGTADNPIILAWADEVANATDSTYDDWAADFYNDDAIPWCGLYMAVVAVRSAQGRPERFPPDKYLAALSWQNWGVSVPKEQAAVGDVMVMRRSGGGHVTLNVGTVQGGDSFYGLGGNQSDRVNIAEFDLDRVVACRRPPYRELPPGARRVILGPSGVLSTNEA